MSWLLPYLIVGGVGFAAGILMALGAHHDIDDDIRARVDHMLEAEKHKRGCALCRLRAEKALAEKSQAT